MSGLLIADSQVHLWAADSPERPWVPGQAWRSRNQPAMDADTMIARMDAAGIHRAIVVPPSFEGDRNDVALDAVRRYPDRFAVMGRVPLHERAAPDVLERWREQPCMLGVRLTFHMDYQRVWLHDGTADWFWPAAEAVGVPVMVLPTGSLPEMADIAARHPGLRLVIDHCSLHRVSLDEPYALDTGEVERLLALARFPNVAVKMSALPFFSNEPYPFADIHPLARAVFEAFGPRRTFWGSDVTRLRCSYREALDYVDVALPGLSTEDRQWLLGRALCEWLDWPLPEGSA